MDPTTLAAFLGALAAPVAGVLIATGRRRETRARQWDDVIAERNALQTRLDDLRHRYDALLDWAYDLRAALHEQSIDVPPMPRDRDR